jgi:hypothetical protein
LAGSLIGWILIRPVNIVLGWFFRWFNRAFDRLTGIYGAGVGKVLRVSLLVLALYGGLLAATYWQFANTPTGFIPQQDKGYLILNVQLPDSASVERTEAAMARIEAIARETAGVGHTLGISGRSVILNANAPNLGSLYVMLAPFDRRRGPGRTAAGRGGDPGPVPAGRRGGRGDGVRGPARGRAGHDRGVQPGDRVPGEHQPRRPEGGDRPDRRAGEPDAGAGKLIQQLRDQHPLAVPRDRPE